MLVEEQNHRDGAQPSNKEESRIKAQEKRFLLQGLEMLLQERGQNSALTLGKYKGWTSVLGLLGKWPGGNLRVAPPTCCSRCS